MNLYLIYPAAALLLIFFYGKEKWIYNFVLTILLTFYFFLDRIFILFIVFHSLAIIIYYMDDVFVSLRSFFRKISTWLSPLSYPLKSLITVIPLILMIIYLFHNSRYKLFREFRYDFPENPVKFLKPLKIKGNIFNTLYTGGYTAFHLFPDNRVFSDSKDFIRDEIIQSVYNEIINADTLWEEELDNYNIDIVLLDFTMDNRGNDPLLWDMLYKSSWKLVFFDDKYALFLRDKPEYKFITDKFSISFFNPFEKNSLYRAVKNDPAKMAEILKNLITFSENSYYLNMYLGVAYNYLSDIKNAREYFRKAIKINPEGFNAYNNLGYMYIQYGEWRNALICFEKAVSVNKN
ncbi:MAG: hypothetical protein KAS39_00730, partial [Actinomycetia bacterium]|nr:hypothetical protein [Actinomycetes bacterium]